MVDKILGSLVGKVECGLIEVIREETQEFMCTIS